MKMLTQNMSSVLIALTATLVLSSCTSVPQIIDIKSKPTQKPKLELPSVDRFVTRPTDWVVITPENAESVFEKMSQDGKTLVVFAMDEKSYQALSLNVTDLLKLVKQQQAVIAAYDTYYETEE